MDNGSNFFSKMNPFKPSTHLPKETTQKDEMTDRFNLNTGKVMSYLKENKGNKHFNSWYNDIFDELIAYVEENKLELCVKMSVNDSVNVVQVFHTDLEEVWKKVQPHKNRNNIQFLKDLQKFNAERLTKLHDSLIIMRKDEEIETWTALPAKSKRKAYEMTDLTMLTDILVDFLDGFSRRSDNSSIVSAVESMNTNRLKYCSAQCYVKVINKLNLGKMMVKYVGNEGTEEKEVLRKLFQACIDNLQKTPDVKMWENASITIYDEKHDTYKIASGTEKYQFICSMYGSEPSITQRYTDGTKDGNCNVM